MQRRLIVAMVGIALASVILVGAGVLILAQIGARGETEREVIERVEALTSDGTLGGPRVDFDRTRVAFGLRELSLVAVGEDGVAFVLGAGRGGRFNVIEGSGVQLDPDQQEAFLDNRTVQIEDPDGEIVRAIRRVEGGDELGVGGRPFDFTLGLMVGQSVTTIGNDARLWFLASAVTVVVGSIVAAWLLARRLVGPLADIEAATSSIASGDFDTRLDIDGDDELADLGRSVNRMAEDLQRSRVLDQQFLLSISHDLRTPLTAITGYAEALSDGAVDDPTHAGGIIRSHADRLERLVGDLLDLAKLDAKRFTLATQTLDVGVAVGRTVAGLTPQAEAHGLSVSFTNAGSLFIDADPDRLAQTIANVVDNAIKFASSEIVVVVEADGHDAVITINNDGPPVAEEDLPHIFDRLYVSSRQPERAENPSGMGLAIVRELTTAMGGTVALTSEPRAGTTMTLRFPRVGSHGVGSADADHHGAQPATSANDVAER